MSKTHQQTQTFTDLILSEAERPLAWPHSNIANVASLYLLGSKA